MSEVIPLVLMLAVIVLPFQLLGVAAYYALARSNVRRAHIAGVLVPALTFFVVFLALFLWRYYHPGMFLLIEGGINLVILIVLVLGTLLHLVVGAIVHLILYRRRRATGL